MHASKPKRVGTKEQKVAEADAQYRAFANTRRLRPALKSEVRSGGAESLQLAGRSRECDRKGLVLVGCSVTVLCVTDRDRCILFAVQKQVNQRQDLPYLGAAVKALGQRAGVADHILPKVAQQPGHYRAQDKSPKVDVPAQRIENSEQWQRQLKAYQERSIKAGWPAAANKKYPYLTAPGGADSKQKQLKRGASQRMWQ